MIVIKALKPDKLAFSMRNYVTEQLGVRFTEVPPLQLKDIFGDSSNAIPIIFILTTGADPTRMLLDFAGVKKKKFEIVSLGQGQGPRAEALIATAKKSGDWVVLQNCHLAGREWLPKMEKVIEELAAPGVQCHDEFRLWLNSKPSKDFPVATLQCSIKLTTEPPKGLRANLIGTFSVMDESYIEGSAKPREWKKLLYGLAFFHALIQERRKFGPLGWNVKYKFNASDVECSMMNLRAFMDEMDEVPWETLVYVTGQINYGGRVTDDQDRVLLMVLVAQYYNSGILDDAFKFSDSGTYYSPAEGNLESILDYTRGLPLEEQPEVFGMHINALTAFNNAETDRIVEVVLGLQPRVSSSGGGEDQLTPEQMVDAAAADILARMPEDIDPELSAPGLLDRDAETGQMHSLATVLVQVRIARRAHKYSPARRGC
jgi:dynein heavy chain